MPYLQAVIKGLRLHPALAMIHPRIVPEEGAVISGKWLPSGVKISFFGCSVKDHLPDYLYFQAANYTISIT